MTTRELNGYRLTGQEEPTDEMLALVMREVREDAVRKKEEATERYFEHLERLAVLQKQSWRRRIENVQRHEKQ